MKIDFAILWLATALLAQPAQNAAAPDRQSRPSTQPAPAGGPAKAEPPDTANVQPVDAPEPLEIEPLTDALAAAVDEWVPKLAAVEYEVREEATRRLIEIGAPAFPKLRDIYKRTGDPEVRLRIERVVHQAYFDHHIFAQKGFLGVSLRPYEPTVPPTLAIPDDTSPIELTDVIDSTAASRAGLEIGDVVIGVDGGPITIEVQDAATARSRRTLPVVAAFSRRIAGHKPGEPIELRFFRDGRIMEQAVILGRVPREIAERGSVTAINEALPRVTRNFELWWNTYFHRAD